MVIAMQDSVSKESTQRDLSFNSCLLVLCRDGFNIQCKTHHDYSNLYYTVKKWMCGESTKSFTYQWCAIYCTMLNIPIEIMECQTFGVLFVWSAVLKLGMQRCLI